MQYRNSYKGKRSSIHNQSYYIEVLGSDNSPGFTLPISVEKNELPKISSRLYPLIPASFNLIAISLKDRSIKLSACPKAFAVSIP